MKKWMGAVLAAALLAGGLTAQADDLTLPAGEVLPLGSRVAVWRGEDSYFAPKLAELLSDPALVRAVAADYIDMGVYSRDEKAAAERMAETALDIIRQSRAYQLRSVSGNTMYTAYVLALPMELPLSEADQLRWNNWIRAYGEANGVSAEKLDHFKAHGELSESMKLGLEAAKMTVKKEGTSPGGVTYQLARTQLTPEILGYAAPIWLCALNTQKGDHLTVTVVLADQASGRYFAPILEKAAEAAR